MTSDGAPCRFVRGANVIQATVCRSMLGECGPAVPILFPCCRDKPGSMTLLAGSRNGQRGGLLPWSLLAIGSTENVAVAEPSAANDIGSYTPPTRLTSGDAASYDTHTVPADPTIASYDAQTDSTEELTRDTDDVHPHDPGQADRSCSQSRYPMSQLPGSESVFSVRLCWDSSDTAGTSIGADAVVFPGLTLQGLAPIRAASTTPVPVAGRTTPGCCGHWSLTGKRTSAHRWSAIPGCPDTTRRPLASTECPRMTRSTRRSWKCFPQSDPPSLRSGWTRISRRSPGTSTASSGSTSGSSSAPSGRRPTQTHTRPGIETASRHAEAASQSSLQRAIRRDAFARRGAAWPVRTCPEPVLCRRAETQPHPDSTRTRNQVAPHGTRAPFWPVGH